MLRMIRNAVVVASIGIGLSSAACSRDHIEAVNKANEADRLVKLNPRGAVKKYEEASQLDPGNHRIFWKLAMAYQKMEEWSKLESTLSRAVAVAPDFADYHYYRGYAQIKMAEAGNDDAYEAAKEPLKKCIETDPNYAECYYWLGQAYLWTGDDQAALENFSQAIEHDPKVGYFYPAPAELYVTLKMYDQADQILKVGERTLDKVQKNKNALYSIYTLMFNVAQGQGDLTTGADALEKANQIAGDEHPETAFNLGSTYGVMDPPKKQKALELLKSFDKRACRTARRAKFKSQCETASSLIQRLGG